MGVSIDSYMYAERRGRKHGEREGEGEGEGNGIELKYSEAMCWLNENIYEIE